MLKLMKKSYGFMRMKKNYILFLKTVKVNKQTFFPSHSVSYHENVVLMISLRDFHVQGFHQMSMAPNTCSSCA